MVPRGSCRIRGGARCVRRAGASPRRRLPGRQPRPRRLRHAAARAVRARRRAVDRLDAGCDRPGQLRLPRRRWSRSGSTRRSASTTPPRAIRCGSTCSRRCRPSCASTDWSTASPASATRIWRCPTRRTRRRSASGDTCPEGTELDLAEGTWLLNPGSVGQPRDGDPRAAWMLLDTERVDGRLPPHRLRHRGRGGGDPRCAAAGLARRAARPRSVACFASMRFALKVLPLLALGCARCPARRLRRPQRAPLELRVGQPAGRARGRPVGLRRRGPGPRGSGSAELCGSRERAAGRRGRPAARREPRGRRLHARGARRAHLHERPDDHDDHRSDRHDDHDGADHDPRRRPSPPRPRRRRTPPPTTPTTPTTRPTDNGGGGTTTPGNSGGAPGLSGGAPPGQLKKQEAETP